MNDASLLTELLTPLGFTPLEAEVYVALLQEAPITGYRVAQAIKRNTANAYKALESLEQKGAVVVEDGSPRRYRAVAPDEVLAGLERSFGRRKKEAQEALAALRTDGDDDRVYQLATPEQVFERCRAMLAACRQIALLDVFPGPLRELRDDVRAAAARGVVVGMLVYEPVQIDGAEIVLSYRAAPVLGRWSGCWLNLVADSKEHVLGLVSADGTRVEHATWSASPFLAHLYHSGLLGEISESALRGAIAREASPDELSALLARLDTLANVDPPAFQRLARSRLT